jgi:hypothetical protein
MEKKLASRLSDAFSQHIPAWQANRNLVFFPKIPIRSGAICVAK